MAHTHGMQRAIRVLEHATRVITRSMLNSTSATNNQAGRLASQLEDYLRRLKRIAKQGKSKQFYKVLQNAQMKLIKAITKVIR